MRKTLQRKSLHYTILAALAAGGLFLPAAGAAQSAAKKSSNRGAAHKSSATKSSRTTKSVKSPAAAATAKSATAKSHGSKSGRISSRKKSSRVKGQAAPTSDRITEIQAALARKGVYSGTPTGKWDDDTAESMKQFQSAHGLKPTGKLDAPTLQKLGLGSETTGLGAPTPPPNSAANRLLNKNTAAEPQE